MRAVVLAPCDVLARSCAGRQHGRPLLFPDLGADSLGRDDEADGGDAARVEDPHLWGGNSDARAEDEREAVGNAHAEDEREALGNARAEDEREAGGDAHAAAAADVGWRYSSWTRAGWTQGDAGEPDAGDVRGASDCGADGVAPSRRGALVPILHVDRL